MLGGCCTWCWGEHLGWFEASRSLSENAPAVSTFLDLSVELLPPAPVHFCIIVVAAHFHQGLGFALIRAGMHLQIFLASRGWDGWHLAAFLHCVPDVTPAPSLPFIFPRVLAPVYARITSLWIYVLWFFSSCSVVALEGDS